MRALILAAIVLWGAAVVAATACGGDEGSLTVYSGRSETLVGPILERFSDDTGVDIRVRYGETAGLAATILEEGDNSPADVFFAQDAGALGALDAEGRLADLPQELLDRVPGRYRSSDSRWVGVSGRARVVAYNTDAVDESDLPDSILAFTDPAWKGRIGWVPTNGSFQAFITALRLVEGEDVARDWLEGIKANEPQEYPNNITALEAVADGEVDVAFVNHYYLLQFIAERGEGVKARNYFLGGGDVGALVNVAGVAILDTAANAGDAERLIEYLLSDDAQRYFAEETYEYPLVPGVPADERLKPLDQLASPELDLSDLSDLEGTLDLLRDTGVLP